MAKQITRAELDQKFFVRDDIPVQGQCAGDRCAALRLINHWNSDFDPGKAIEFCEQMFANREPGSRNICHTAAVVIATTLQSPDFTVPEIFTGDTQNA